MTDSETPPKYNVATVESVILRLAVELNPRDLSARDLALKIVSDPQDRKEFETAAQAIRGLCEVRLLADPYEETVEPTPAGTRAVELLT